jgi:hypothetical protein
VKCPAMRDETEDAELALQLLNMAAVNLRHASVDGARAVPLLYGSRAARAAELAAMVSDAVSHCHRLTTVITGDLRAELK